jgi:hypothetical protein
MSKFKGFKAFTHDLCSPIQGGDPIWDGSLPYILPKVEVDISDEECGAGWNFTKELKTALKITGFWPNGRPSRVFRVETNEEVFERGNKCRTSCLSIVSEVSEEEINEAILNFSSVFAPFSKEMFEEQIKWRKALSRQNKDLTKVEEGLKEALKIRGLSSWKLKQYSTIEKAWDTRYAWSSWDARSAQKARSAWEASDAWDARADREAWDAWSAWSASAAWDAWSAWEASDALTVYFASKQGWIKSDSNLLTHGIRSAYEMDCY